MISKDNTRFRKKTGRMLDDATFEDMNKTKMATETGSSFSLGQEKKISARFSRRCVRFLRCPI